MKRCMLVGVSVVAVWLLVRPATLVSQVLERSLYVSMLDESGAPVPNLGPTDFIVREDNVAREVLRVVPASDPMQIAVMVDNSAASGPFVANIRRALPPFIEKLGVPSAAGRRNEIALITLASRPTILADFTVEPAAVVKASERVWEESFVGGYYLLNGIIEISKGFRLREATRPVIVAIISEGPELSSRHPDQVLEPLRDVGAALHVIALGLPRVSIEDEARFRDEVVDQGPRVSGGTRSQLLSASALPGKLDQLAAVLTKAYRVTYGHPDTLIPPERITVSAKRADITAHGTPVKEPKAPQ